MKQVSDARLVPLDTKCIVKSCIRYATYQLVGKGHDLGRYCKKHGEERLQMIRETTR